jgi:hypothetical protein
MRRVNDEAQPGNAVRDRNDLRRACMHGQAQARKEINQRALPFIS